MITNYTIRPGGNLINYLEINLWTRRAGLGIYIVDVYTCMYVWICGCVWIYTYLCWLGFEKIGWRELSVFGSGVFLEGKNSGRREEGSGVRLRWVIFFGVRVGFLGVAEGSKER